MSSQKKDLSASRVQTALELTSESSVPDPSTSCRCVAGVTGEMVSAGL
jgi:hypothetical protein